MERKPNVDDLIREALEAEGIEALKDLREPSLPDMVTDVFRGQLRWYGAMFLAMILLFSTLAVFCAVRFMGTDEVALMIRWGAGFFLCVIAVMGGKNWYWMQMERLAMTREIKRVELLVAQLICELRGRA
ncbi:MAG: hypothetical protein EDS66_17725 [Planctomycetota bacterium]|nr:MAG: hypothetical protein EDS66_17725 [Planctomycetota bacterium]